MKDAFCELEKARVLKELQASYNAKLPSIYAEQYEHGYWASYAEAKRIASGDCEPPIRDAAEPTHIGTLLSQAA